MRDRLIDGYRGIAVSCVVCAHSLAYHFRSTGPIAIRIERLADPFAEMGVQLFFVISGYIITTLLVREEQKAGRISIPAFYVRRFFRILPPLFVYYAALAILRFAGTIEFDTGTIRNSALFTCNTGFTDCEWWVAHTWSLAVEEQFYLAWPLLLAFLPAGRRVPFLLLVLTGLLFAFLIMPYQWHSNWISFSCIASGALYSLSARLRDIIKRGSNYLLWIGAGLLFALGPVFLVKPLLVLTPLLILFILFAARELPLLRRVLESGPLQAVGLCSYSLYLWQQVFLAQPQAYHHQLPLAALPVVVALSFFLIERPCARIGHKLSAYLQTERPQAATSAG